MFPIIRDNFLDFDFPAFPSAFSRRDIMRTDITETEDGFRMDVDLPGFKKDEIDLTLREGNLVITATKKGERDNSNERYVQRERFYGTTSRSFCVGNNIKLKDIKAKYNNGILHIDILQKKENLKEEEKITVE